MKAISSAMLVGLVAASISLLPRAANSGNLLENIKHEAGSCVSGGCDAAWHINQRIDGAISSKMEAAIEPVKKAFIDAMREVFQNDIDPMLDKVDTITTRQLDKIDQIIQGAIKTAQSATDQTIDKVRDDIIKETSKQIQELSKSILGDAKCLVAATANETQVVIDENLRVLGSLRDSISNLFSRCGTPDRKNYWSVYSVMKCGFDIKMSKAGRIEDVVQNYRFFLETTARAQCILEAEDNKKAVQKNEADLVRRIHIWDLAQQ